MEDAQKVLFYCSFLSSMETAGMREWTYGTHPYLFFIDVLTILSQLRAGLRKNKIKNKGQNHLVVRNEAHCCLQTWSVMKTSRFYNASQESLSATDYSNKDKRLNVTHLPVFENNY